MSNCGNLYDSVIDDCSFVPDYTGETIYIINYDDILYVQFDGYFPQDIRTLGQYEDVLKLFLYGATYAYKIEGKNNSVEPGYYVYEQLYEDVYAHYVDISVFNINAEIKEELEKLPKGKYVILVENKRTNTYEIYGLFNGLVVTEKERNVYDEDGSDNFFISFESDIERPELHIPHKYLGDVEWLTTDHWILWDGWWDDSGIWMDDQPWNDN